MNKPFKQYLFEYRHDGAVWAFEIAAASPEDAKARMKQISWAQYKGEIAATIPVPGGGLLARLIAALQGR